MATAEVQLTITFFFCFGELILFGFDVAGLMVECLVFGMGCGCFDDANFFKGEIYMTYFLFIQKSLFSESAAIFLKTLCFFFSPICSYLPLRVRWATNSHSLGIGID